MEMVIWNVAGIKNEDREFWEGLREWDILIFCETWLDRKRWERIKRCQGVTGEKSNCRQRKIKGTSYGMNASRDKSGN